MKITIFAAAAILTMLGTPPQSAMAQDASARTIEVSGQGEAHAKADWASLNLAIETHAPTAAQAGEKNAALAEKVISELKKELGENGKISTGNYSLNPEYDQRPGRETPRIVGYNAQNSITVETGELNSVGATIDSAIAAGANRVNYLSLTLKNDSKARSEAIAGATRDAHAQAEAIASALGVRLGRIIKATTVVEPRPMPMARGPVFASAMGVSPTTPVEAGDITVPATVYLTYAIE
ncbi:MAG TPA: SIMPL domain-containing protein [Candidatus Binataceae bacterium]|nr:SIMPL domain-containing protein [Candidatus Binataceae bacterium]